MSPQQDPPEVIAAPEGAGDQDPPEVIAAPEGAGDQDPPEVIAAPEGAGDQDAPEVIAAPEGAGDQDAPIESYVGVEEGSPATQQLDADYIGGADEDESAAERQQSEPIYIGLASRPEPLPDDPTPEEEAAYDAALAAYNDDQTAAAATQQLDADYIGGADEDESAAERQQGDEYSEYLGTRQTIRAGLSSLIEIRVPIRSSGDYEIVGAIQQLQVAEARRFERVQELASDGIVEILPISATDIEIRAERLVFDSLRLPEAFARGFQHIQAQVMPFDLQVKQKAGMPTEDSNPPHQKDYEPEVRADYFTALDEYNAKRMRTTVYNNCWFVDYNTIYKSGAYLIMETAVIWAERAYNTSSIPVENGNNFTWGGNGRNEKPHVFETDFGKYPWVVYESAVNEGSQLGGLDHVSTALSVGLDLADGEINKIVS